MLGRSSFSQMEEVPVEGQSKQNHMLPVVLSFSRAGEDEGAEPHAQGPQITKPWMGEWRQAWG